MKTIIIKSFMLLIVAFGACTIVNAQTENTGERLIDQLKNGTAPGLLFSNERPAPAPAARVKLNEREGLVAQIRKGTAPGMQFKSGGGAGASRPVAARMTTAAAGKPLASEQKAVAEQAKPAQTVVIPTQE